MIVSKLDASNRWLLVGGEMFTRQPCAASFSECDFGKQSWTLSSRVGVDYAIVDIWILSSVWHKRTTTSSQLNHALYISPVDFIHSATVATQLGAGAAARACWTYIYMQTKWFDALIFRHVHIHFAFFISRSSYRILRIFSELHASSSIISLLFSLCSFPTYTKFAFLSSISPNPFCRDNSINLQNTNMNNKRWVASISLTDSVNLQNRQRPIDYVVLSTDTFTQAHTHSLTVSVYRCAHAICCLVLRFPSHNDRYGTVEMRKRCFKITK